MLVEGQPQYQQQQRRAPGDVANPPSGTVVDRVVTNPVLLAYT